MIVKSNYAGRSLSKIVDIAAANVSTTLQRRLYYIENNVIVDRINVNNNGCATKYYSTASNLVFMMSMVLPSSSSLSSSCRWYNNEQIRINNMNTIDFQQRLFATNNNTNNNNKNKNSSSTPIQGQSRNVKEIKENNSMTTTEKTSYLHIAPDGDWWTGDEIFAAKHLQPDYVKSIPISSSSSSSSDNNNSSNNYHKYLISFLEDYEDEETITMWMQNSYDSNTLCKEMLDELMLYPNNEPRNDDDNDIDHTTLP